MLVSELIAKTAWQCVSDDASTKQAISGVVIGDLLSHIMATGEVGQAWITIQGHLNIVAVAALKEFSCIIVCDGSPLDPDVVAKANEEHIAIIRCELPQFEVAKVLVAQGY